MTALLAAAASGFAPARPEAQGAACVHVLEKVPYAAQRRWLCTGLLAEIMTRGNGQRSRSGAFSRVTLTLGEFAVLFAPNGPILQPCLVLPYFPFSPPKLYKQNIWITER